MMAQLLPGLFLAALVAGLAWARAARVAGEPVGESDGGPAVDPERAGDGLAGEGIRPGEPPPVEFWVDPAAVRVSAGPAWADPRWLAEVQALLARHPPFPVSAPERLAPLAAELAALSFVERVEELRATAADGLAVALVLREPVACIPVREGFALVDEDGVVLAGRWPEPPRLGRAFLPVLGPLDDPLFARARDGDWLVEPEHTDALDVALSLAAHVDEGRRAELGRIVIDARDARRASVEDPGVCLGLEGERLALFGRVPGTDEPGELRAAAKWDALGRALELFARDPASDWELVDLRWDRPDLALRNAPNRDSPIVAALDEPAPRARTEPERPPRAPDASKPQVR